jgi:outer membrane protein TolC
MAECMKRLLLIGVLYALPLFAKDVYSFQELLRATKEHSPQLLQKRLQTDMAKSDLDIAKSLYYPTLSLSATSQYGHKFKDTYAPSSVGDDSLTQATQYQSSTSLNLNYEITKFGATQASIDAAKHKVNAFAFEECAFLEKLLQSLVSNYQQVRVMDKKLQSFSKIQHAYEELYTRAKRLFNSGMISQSEVSNYALELAEVLTNIAQAKEQKLYALAELRYISGVELQETTVFQPYETQFDSLHVKSFEESFEANQMKSQIEQKRELLKAEQRAYFPTLSLFGRYDAYGYDKDSFAKSMGDVQENGYRIGVSLYWNLFDGFKREAAIKRRLLELEEAKVAFVEAKRVYAKEQEILNSLAIKKEDELNKQGKNRAIAEELASMSERLYTSGEIDRLASIKSLIVYHENLLKEEEAKEELSMIKMKQMIKQEGVNRCAIVD